MANIIQLKPVKMALQALREQVQEDDSLKKDGDRLLRTMQSADSYIEEIRDTTCGVEDAKLYNTLNIHVRNQVGLINLNEAKFVPGEFAARILTHLKTPTNELASAQSWIRLGREFMPHFCRPPALHYLFGSFLTQEECSEKSPKRVRNVRPKKPQRSQQATEFIHQAREVKSPEDDVSRNVRHVFSVLKKVLETRRGSKSMDLFQFCVDADSFSRTISNLFHVSFLVKERKVHLMRSDGSIKIVLLEDKMKEGEGFNFESGQSLITITQADWQALVSNNQLRGAFIPPYVHVSGIKHIRRK